MRNINLRIYKIISIVFISIILILVGFLALITYENRYTTAGNAFLYWAIQNHFTILITLIIVAIIFGGLVSIILFGKIQKNIQTSKDIKKILFLFLANDEKEILNHLMDNNGKASQSDISKLNGMNRVKAFRSLNKLQSRDIITIESFGKVRKVSLKENVMNFLVQ